MPTPTRILRSLAEELDPTMFDRTLRQECQFQRIMKVAPTLLTFWSGDRITFSALAIAMRMAPSTLRYHFVDIPALLGYLIREHLRAITTATAQIPRDAPDLLRRRRAAYLEFTRKPLGAHTLMHLLMLNNLPILPDDVRLPLIDQLNQIAANLAPPGQAEIVLSLLDNPYLTPHRLEDMMATGEHLEQEDPWPEIAAPEPAALPEPPELAHTNGDDLPGDIWINASPSDPLEDATDAQLSKLRARLAAASLEAAPA